MGVVTPRAAAHVPRRLPGGVARAAARRDRPRRPLQPALQRHRGDRRLRRAAPRDRRPDRLHVGRLGAADRRARRRGAARRAVRGCAAAREIMSGEHAVGRVIARPFRGEPGAFVRTDGPQGPRAPAARRAPTWRSCRPPACRSTRSARSARCSTASASTSSTRAPTNAAALGGHGRADRRARRRLRVHQPRRDRPGLRPPQRRPGLPRRAAGDRRRGGRWLERLDPARDLLVITADHGCDPTTPGTDHTREHVPLLARFDGHGGRRHDGPFADVGASVLRG